MSNVFGIVHNYVGSIYPTMISKSPPIIHSHDIYYKCHHSKYSMSVAIDWRVQYMRDYNTIRFCSIYRCMAIHWRVVYRNWRIYTIYVTWMFPTMHFLVRFRRNSVLWALCDYYSWVTMITVLDNCQRPLWIWHNWKIYPSVTVNWTAPSIWPIYPKV